MLFQKDNTKNVQDVIDKDMEDNDSPTDVKKVLLPLISSGGYNNMYKKTKSNYYLLRSDKMKYKNKKNN